MPNVVLDNAKVSASVGEGKAAGVLDFACLPAPAVVVEISQLVEAALQILGLVALFFGHLPPRHPATPLEVSLRIVVPARSLKTAPEALIGLRLDDSDTRIRIASGAFTFDIALRIIAPELEGEATAVKPVSLRHGPAGSENEN